MVAKLNKKEILLNKAKNLILEQKECLRENGGYMNIFSIVNSERYEVRTHSNMIYYLLNPKSDHLMGEKYISLFIKSIGFPEYADLIWSVEREKMFDNGRIDFFLSCGQMYIAIEMKIDAKDQKEQLKRYEEYCKKRLKSKQTLDKMRDIKDYRICYLTLDGHDPSPQSVKRVHKNKLILLSFDEHIKNWLNECIENTDKKKQSRSALKQYLILIESLTKQNEGNMKMANLLMNSENYRAFLELCEEEITVKKRIVIDFYNELLKKMPHGFYPFEHSCSPEQFYDTSRNVLEYAFATGKKYTNKSNRTFDLIFAFGFTNSGDSSLYCGFVLQDTKTGKPMKYPKNTDDIFEHFGIFDDEFDGIVDDNWLAWDYILSKDEDYYSFKYLTEPVINMLDKSGMRDETDFIAAYMNSYMKKIRVKHSVK